MENPSMSMLDKFKRRLVRDIARRLYHEKQTENEMWEQLREEYGCDCHLLWEHMRALTLKKLKRLLAAEDRIDYITRIARMTSTDWLTFDLVLVHEKVDVIGEELKSVGKPEPAVLTHLFDLVQKYNIEMLPPRFLAEAWYKLTQEYNTGGRQCSPMLLQRRWYQMKDTTRTKVYDFWQSYRGNPKLLGKAYKQKPTALQVKIAERYRSLITEPFEQWEDLIKNKKIIPPGAFEKKKFKDQSSSNSENDPDLIVVEPIVETIEVGADSDGDEVDKKDETTNTGTDVTNGAKELVIKVEPTDSLIGVEEANAIKQLESISIPIATADNRLVERLGDFEKSSTERTDIVLPKITSVMGNVVMLENNAGENVVTDKNAQEIVQESKTGFCDDDDDDVQIISTTPTDKDTITIDDNDTNTEVIGKDVNSVDKVSDFDEQLMDLEFVDDGIELEDNEVESHDDELPEETEKGQGFSDIPDENNIECKIDRKLIMFPITYTRKIDHMEIFRNTSFLTVKGKDIIERALAESKPIFNKTSKEEQSDEEESDDVTESFPRLNFSDWRLQKPKNRSYNPIKLCKNPDFNTRLKKLTVGFFSSERNRLLYSACKPLTVDLHKAFESSLDDNTLYLERTDSPVIKKEKEIVECKNTVSVIPSAIAVQSLIDTNKAKVQELLQAKERKPEEQTPINSVVTERNKIVKLPDIQQVRLANQCLLTAEVSPITLGNNTSPTKPPVKLVNVVSPAASPPATSHSDIVSKEITPVNVVHNDINAKRFVKRKWPAPKIKTPNTLPPWSLCSKPDPVYESLITKDTLYKMLCLLNGVDIKNDKQNKRCKKKTQTVDNEALVNKETNCTVKEKAAEVQTHISSKNVGRKPNTSKLVTISSESKKVTEDEKTNKSKRTISSKSGYCCWAQYRLQNLNSVRKLRHLCPKPICKCCCRNYLVGKFLHAPRKSDSTEDLTTPHSSIENPSTIREDTSMNTVTLQQSDERRQLDRNSEIRSQVRAKVSTIDTAKDNLNSACPIQPFDSLQKVSWTDEAIQATNTISLAGDRSEEVGDCENVPLLSPKSLMKTTATAELLDTDVEQTNLRHQYSTNVESSVIETDTFNNQPDNNTGSISLLSDDEVTSTPEIKPPDADQVLPNGVKLLLLPDNTLSLSIDPDAQIGQSDLTKLPEILSAVQNQLTNSVVLKSSFQNVFTSAANPNSDLNVSSSNGECKAIQVVRTEDNMNQASVSSVQENIDINNTQLIVATQSHTGNNNSDIIYQDSRENSNSSPFILKFNDNLVESTHSYSFVNLNEREIVRDTLNSTQENVASETNVTNLNCNRKTILSDLMTLSGISQEDSHVPTEEAATIQNSPAPKIQNTVNYNIYNNTASLNTQQNVPNSKPIKKIIVSIRKKRKQNYPLYTDSIIDLTEDCNTTTNTDEINNQNVTVIRKIVKGLNVSTAGKVNPPFRFHPYRPIILKRISKTSMPYQITQENVNVDPLEHPQRVEIRRRKSFPGNNPKQTTTRGSVYYHAGVDDDGNKTNRLHNRYDSDSDSSDDEPLAKKMRRIRGSSSTAQNNDASIGIVDNIVPVEEYNIPVEFESEPLTKENLAVHDKIQESYAEESCIFGV